MPILNRILRREHLEAGLYLETDDHNLYLKQGSRTLAIFSARGATLEEILYEADQTLNWLKSGIEFEPTTKPDNMPDAFQQGVLIGRWLERNGVSGNIYRWHGDPP